jgi:hypothetical protein
LLPTHDLGFQERRGRFECETEWREASGREGASTGRGRALYGGEGAVTLSGRKKTRPATTAPALPTTPTQMRSHRPPPEHFTRCRLAVAFAPREPGWGGRPAQQTRAAAARGPGPKVIRPKKRTLKCSRRNASRQHTGRGQITKTTSQRKIHAFFLFLPSRKKGLALVF